MWGFLGIWDNLSVVEKMVKVWVVLLTLITEARGKLFWVDLIEFWRTICRLKLDVGADYRGLFLPPDMRTQLLKMAWNTGIKKIIFGALCVWLCISLPTYMVEFVCLCLHVCLSLSACLSLSVCLSMHACLHVSTCLPVSACLPVYSACLDVLCHSVNLCVLYSRFVLCFAVCCFGFSVICIVTRSLYFPVCGWVYIICMARCVWVKVVAFLCWHGIFVSGWQMSVRCLQVLISVSRQHQAFWPKLCCFLIGSSEVKYLSE